MELSDSIIHLCDVNQEYFSLIMNSMDDWIIPIDVKKNFRILWREIHNGIECKAEILNNYLSYWETMGKYLFIFSSTEHII